MKTLYLECNMGAAGDMLSASLLELAPDPQEALQKLNGLGIPGVRFEAAPTQKCGICGTRLRVTVRGEEEESRDPEAQTCEMRDCGDEMRSGGHDPHDHDHDHAHGGHAHGLDHDHAHGGHDLHDCGHAHGHDGHEHDSHVHDSHDHDHAHGGHGKHDHDHGHAHAHSHTSLLDIAGIAESLHAPQKVREDILRVYRLIADAEGHAHGRPVEEVHFHEVGALDAVADIAAFCLLLHELAPDAVLASPVTVGFGEVHCAHGILPVPAPATAWILRDVPVQAGRWRGELCTPTGAALLKAFAKDFAPMPQMRIQKVGIGCGKKDFPQANCVRAFLGEASETGTSTLPGGGPEESGSASLGGTCDMGGPSRSGAEKTGDPPLCGADIADISVRSETTGSGDLPLCGAEKSADPSRSGADETILELSCNLDDMTPEAVGFAMDALFAEGALDVFAVPVTMKKSRPGILLSCLCRPELRERIVACLFRHTATLGVREYGCARYTLERTQELLHTPQGDVRLKRSCGWGVCREKYEYEDLARIARTGGMALDEARSLAEEARRGPSPK